MNVTNNNQVSYHISQSPLIPPPKNEIRSFRSFHPLMESHFSPLGCLFGAIMAIALANFFNICAPQGKPAIRR